MENKQRSLREKSIVLIGFMGVGKTTIGQAIAKKLNWEFLDTDEEIEKIYAMPTSEIFKKFGEAEFREKEKEKIIQLCNQKQKIISVGGGAFLQEAIQKECLSKCNVIHLDMSWEAWIDRINLIIDSRPVLQGKNIDEIRELFTSRQPIYKHHHFKINTDNLDPEQAADLIIAKWAGGTGSSVQIEQQRNSME